MGYIDTDVNIDIVIAVERDIKKINWQSFQILPKTLESLLYWGKEGNHYKASSFYVHSVKSSVCS